MSTIKDSVKRLLHRLKEQINYLQTLIILEKLLIKAKLKRGKSRTKLKILRGDTEKVRTKLQGE